MFSELSEIIQIIFADIILSGDNALIIGMAAAGLPVHLRKKAIFIGMALAAGMRIFFAIIAVWLLQIKGVLFFGGILLAWVCWRFYKDLLEFNKNSETSENNIEKPNKFSRAIFTIIVADVSMSIDNVVAVAAIARDNVNLLIFGLVLAIAFMAFFASIIMKIMLKYKWLSWLGLFFLIYLTIMMLYDGINEFDVAKTFIQQIIT